jgi:hypothetical protein
MAMGAIQAKILSGYGELQPQAAKKRVLVHVTPAGVTPLGYTVLSI